MKRRYKIFLFLFLLSGLLVTTVFLALLWAIPEFFARQLPQYVVAGGIFVRPWEKQIVLHNLRVTGDERCPEANLIQINKITLQVSPMEVLITAAQLQDAVIDIPMLQTCGWPREPKILPPGDDVVAWKNLKLTVQNAQVILSHKPQYRVEKISGGLRLSREATSFNLYEVELTAEDSWGAEHELSGFARVGRNYHPDEAMANLSLKSQVPNLAVAFKNFSLPVLITRGTADVNSKLQLEKNKLELALTLHIYNLMLKSRRPGKLFLADAATLVPLLEDAPGLHILKLNIKGRLDDPKFLITRRIRQEIEQAIRRKAEGKIEQLKNTLNSFRNLLPIR